MRSRRAVCTMMRMCSTPLSCTLTMVETVDFTFCFIIIIIIIPNGLLGFLQPKVCFLFVPVSRWIDCRAGQLSDP